MKDDGTFPNNEWYPLILFKNAFHGSQGKGEHLITEGGWMSPWVWGIFPYHHYHSTAWELLLCVKGHAHMQLGGESGPCTIINMGDIVYVPPGLTNKQLDSNGGFSLLGAYPSYCGLHRTS